MRTIDTDGLTFRLPEEATIIESRWRGTCTDCPDPIRIGQPIVFIEKGCVTHVECYYADDPLGMPYFGEYYPETPEPCGLCGFVSCRCAEEYGIDRN